jgi:Fic family protein
MATTAIEGNTLTEEEVHQRIEGKGKLPPSREYLGQEVDNIIAAANRMLEEIKESKFLELTAARIRELNGTVLQKLDLEEGVVPGNIRDYSVGIGGGRYRGAPAEDCAFLLERLCQWLEEEAFNSLPGGSIVAAIIKAVLAHLYIAWIHPFGDGNGRTARLVEFQLLISSGIPSPAAHLLSNHYNLTRTEYYRRLDKAREPQGVSDFMHYAIQGFLDGLKIQLDEIMEQVVDVSWRNYVYERFRTKVGRTHDRRRDLVLDLSSRARGPVSVDELRRISSRVMDWYEGKTRKTFVRDIKELEKMGLVEASGGRIRAKKELMLTYLPESAGREEEAPAPTQLKLQLEDN